MTTQQDTDVRILGCSAADIPVCAEIISQAFKHNAPFVDIFFPNHDTDGRSQLVQRLQKWLKSDSSAHFIKAEKDGKQFGFAVWTHMTASNLPPEDLTEAENVDAIWGHLGGDGEAEKRFVKQIWHSYVQPRRASIFKVPKEKGVMVLEMLAVHPDSQGMGLGEKLTQWGCKKADEQGIESVVESTPSAKRCYAKCGFEIKEERMKFEVGKEFEGRKLPELLFMWRGARG